MSPWKDRRSASFSSDCEDVMEESSVLSATLSPPRSCRSSNRKINAVSCFSLDSATYSSCDTPKSCRLFQDDSEDPLATTTNTPYRHTTLKYLSLNDETIGSHISDTEQSKGRKRSSLEGRHIYKRFENSYLVDQSGSDESDVTMYSSPRLSPNSFITMDGRFVQSKNPFSSPMMDDTPVSSHRYNVNLMQATKAAPSLPVSFFSTTYSDTKIPNLLPPRHQQRNLTPTPGGAFSRALATPLSTATTEIDSGNVLNGGYPDKRFGFTGSPILEAAYEAAAMEIGLPSAGSLRKVRKLNLCDDVVSATFHDLSTQQKLSSSSSLTVTTAYNNHFVDNGLEEQGVSPTDVIGFRNPTPVKFNAPPPTPVKTKPNNNPYNHSYRATTHTPRPPLLERRRPASSRTPHPGLLIPGNSDEDVTDNENIGVPKSRFYSDFDVIGELGEGSFGKVYKVLSRFDGCMYAIKAAHRRAKGVLDRDRMLKEVYALAALSDQADTANFHIVRYHQAWMEDDRLFIQTELCVGTLTDEIKKGTLAFEARRYKLLREMLLALDFIHRNNMVHLDIKPDNIFIKNDQYKLGDFGLVTKLSSNQDVEEGDSRYISMELLSGGKNDLTKSDIFSLGATLYEICLGRTLPMNGDEWRDIRARKLSALPSTGEDMVNIIIQMMDPIPSLRPTPMDLLQHKQLLSEEQKALHAAKKRVEQANLQLAFQQHQFEMLGPIPPIQRRGLTRANTWNGTTTLPYL